MKISIQIDNYLSLDRVYRDHNGVNYSKWASDIAGKWNLTMFRINRPISRINCFAGQDAIEIHRELESLHII